MRSKFNLLLSVGFALVLPLTIAPLPSLSQAPPIQSPGPSSDSRKTEADRLSELGDQQVNDDKPQEALKSYQAAIDLYRKEGNRLSEGLTLRGMGNAYLSLKDFEKALEAQQQALAIARQIHNTDLEARALNNIGNVYRESKQLSKAIDFYQQSLKLSQRTNNYRIAQIAANGLGNAYQIEENSKQSLESFKLALVMARNIPRESRNQVFEIPILDKIGDAYRSIKNFREAATAYEEGILIARKMERSDLEMELGIGLGRAYLGLGDYDKTISTAQRTIEIAKQLNRKSVHLSALELLMITRNIQIDKLRDTNPNQAIADANEMIARVAEARPLATELKDQDILRSMQTWEGYAYWRRANAAFEQNNVLLAEADFKTAQSMFESLDHVDGKASVLSSLISIYLKTNQWKKVSPLLVQSLELAKKNRSLLGQVFDLNTTAAFYLDLGDPKMTVKIATQSIEVSNAIEASKLPKVNPKGSALRLLARAAVQLGDFDQAIAATQQRRILSQQAGDRFSELDILTILAKIYYDQGNFEASQKTRENVLQQLGTLTTENPTAIAMARSQILYQLNFDYLANNNTVKAEQVLKDSLQTIRSLKGLSLGTQGLEIDTLTGFVNLYVTTKEYAKALSYGTEAYNLAIASKNPNFEIVALKFLNTIDFAQGKVGKVLARADRMIEIAQTMKNPGDRGELLIAIAGAYIQLGNYSMAQKLLQQTLSEARKTGREVLESQALSSLAAIAFGTGKTQETIDFSTQNITLSQHKSPRLAATSYLVMSAAQGELKHQKLAFDAAEAALKIGKSSKNLSIERSALNMLGSLDYRFGKIDSSIERFQSALTLSKKSDDDWGLYAGLARSYEAKKQKITAIAFYKKAINELESIRNTLKDTPIELQRSYLQTTIDFGGVKTSDIYRYLADLLIQQGRIAEAQQVMELLRIQELNDLNPATRTSPSRLAELALNPTEQAIQTQHDNLIAFGQKTRDCKQKCTELKSQLATQRGQFEAYTQTIQKTVSEGNLVRIDERNKDFIASASKIVNATPNTVLIYPLVLPDKIHLLWASKGGVLSSVTCPMKEETLNKTIGEFQQALAINDDIRIIKKHGKTLYDCLIKPLEEKGDWAKNKIQNLVIAADRSIHYLPIAALYDGEKFLLERYTVSNVLNAGLTNVDDRLPASPTVLGFGISDALDGSVPLPNVQKELGGIIRSDRSPQGLYAGKLFFNQDTTIATLEENLSNHPILHIATHGLFNAAKPNESYLLFSDGKPGGADRYTVSRIQQQDDLRKVHLVILSACQTAQTESLSNGTEIQSMSSAFLRDRAKSVIASLWNVNDASTSLLMQNFYRNLATGKLTKAQALRQAQLQLFNGTVDGSPNRSDLEPRSTTPDAKPIAQSMRHPYYWAPFILIGNSN